MSRGSCEVPVFEIVSLRSPKDLALFRFTFPTVCAFAVDVPTTMATRNKSRG